MLEAIKAYLKAQEEFERAKEVWRSMRYEHYCRAIDRAHAEFLAACSDYSEARAVLNKEIIKAEGGK